ncbi:hypothetical protein [Aliikangiella coralliicola]|uniref:Uncharacterized protein n=1 Tax=Aliikangiella coralliicola TaxID=2592383 RepID=A0A545TSP9_9GAMM|nr:hypothetical protein [Aliikangiella coralliicola]TQV80245.1 hypothetical protein FLL46_26365 [Aliikangiella coralliicola]
MENNDKIQIFIEHLRRIHFTIVSLSFLAIAFLLLPKNTLFNKVHSQAEMLMVLRNYMVQEEKIILLNDESRKLFQKHHNLFLNKYATKTYTSPNLRHKFTWEPQLPSELLISIQGAKKITDTFHIVGHTIINNNKDEKLNFYIRPTNKVESYSEFISNFNFYFNQLYYEIPVELDLKKVTLWPKLENTEYTELTTDNSKSDNYAKSIVLLTKNHLDGKLNIDSFPVISIESPKNSVFRRLFTGSDYQFLIPVIKSKKIYKSNNDFHAYLLKHIEKNRLDKKLVSLTPELGKAYKDQFKEIHNLVDGMPQIPISELKSYLDKLKPIFDTQLEAFGAKFNGSVFGVILIFLLVGSNIYFGLHWQTLTILCGKDKIEIANQFPWIGIYSNFLSKIIFIFSLSIVPSVVCLLIYQESIDSTYSEILGLGTSLALLTAAVNICNVITTKLK